MAYIGNLPKNALFLFDSFNGNDSDVAFTMKTAPGTAASILVFIDGVRQSTEAFTLSGTTITFDSAPPLGVHNIQIIHIAPQLSAIVPSDGSVTDDKLTTTGVFAGSYGDESKIPILTVNAKGRVTSVANVSVNIPEAGINPLLFTGT